MNLFRLFKHDTIRSFVMYGMVGLMNTALSLTVMFLAASLGLGYMWYTFLGYVVGIMCSFFMNLRYTFRVQGNIWNFLPLFLAVNTFNLCVVEAIEYVLVEHFSYTEWMVVGFGMFCYSVGGFFANRYIVARQFMVHCE